MDAAVMAMPDVVEAAAVASPTRSSAADQRVIARCIEECEMHISPESGHLLLVDSPKLAAPLITELPGR